MKFNDSVNDVQLDYVLVPLSKGKFAMVSPEDAAKVLAFKWHYKSGYASRNSLRTEGKRSAINMHRFLLDAQPGHEVDHVNGDPLDNRRSNLRLADRNGQNRNQAKRKDNSSGFKGVSLNKTTNRWEANIRINGKKKFLGYFPTSIEAAWKYDAAARELFGEFARFNFPFEGEQGARS